MGRKSRLKKELKFLGAVAGALPVINEVHYGRRILPFDPTKKVDGPVVQRYPYHVAINHKRRLRKAFEANGQAGIMSYLDSVQRTRIRLMEQAKKRSPEVEPEVNTIENNAIGGYLEATKQICNLP